MPITQAQRAQAEQRQWAAARDGAAQTCLLAGPGTGKSATIERRVAHLLNNNADPRRVYVISFTRATAKELEGRISQFCAAQPCAARAHHVRVFTMHKLALRILRRAAVLATLYPSDPMILDEWETRNIYDEELANTLGCTPGRAAEVRLAHDAQWQTLSPQAIAQAAITQAERQAFDVFHTTRRNLYSCVLPGELIYECVQRIQQNAIQQDQLPPLDYLVVDEYQDLNACDQEFIRLLVRGGATLFVAGDDDQSIYSFRHANPVGIVQFNGTYPQAATHTLTDCFRCSPAVLAPATQMIGHNPNRIPKQLNSLYAAAAPPVQGMLHAWSFQNAANEAAAIAQSCQELIANGMAGQEDEIVILISNRRLQLEPIVQQLANLGLPFDPPTGPTARDEEPVRAAYSILRIVRDQQLNAPDYVALRALLAQLHGVGANTAKAVGDLCVANNQNFHALFHQNIAAHWLAQQPAAALARVRNILQLVAAWTMQDTIAMRAGDIAHLLQNHVFSNSNQAATHVRDWNGFAASLPQGMSIEEVLEFVSANDEADQRRIFNDVNQRLGIAAAAAGIAQRRIRILTMHGAKGLSGKVVFIPSVEQGIMPSFRAIQAAGLLNEQRRLFYVSLTRAKAACIVSHALLHTGADAFLIQGQPQVRLTRSQFLNEMGVPSSQRTRGLTRVEACRIIQEVNNL